MTFRRPSLWRSRRHGRDRGRVELALTTLKLQLLMCLLAVAGLVVSVWWIWPRLSARTWPAIIGRVCVLLGNQLLTFLAVALAVNNYFGYYAGWNDLFGTGDDAVALIVAD